MGRDVAIVVGGVSVLTSGVLVSMALLPPGPLGMR